MAFVDDVATTHDDVDDVFTLDVVNIFDRLFTKYCCSSDKANVNYRVEKKNIKMMLPEIRIR